MTINILHTLTGGRRIMQLIVAERSPTENMIAVRAIRRPNPDLEVRPVMNLAEARAVLGGARPPAALVASGLTIGRVCRRSNGLPAKGAG